MDFHLIDTIYETIDSPSRIEEVGIETTIEDSYRKNELDEKDSKWTALLEMKITNSSKRSENWSERRLRGMNKV